MVQLVSSPDLDAEIRFDLNDGFSWPDHNGFSLGAPPLLGDPGGVGAEYGFRTLSFTLIVEGDEDSALRQHSYLARQLLRDENYLRFQLSPQAAPIWFRCVRSSPGESSLAKVYLDRATNEWSIGVALVADPFALGERVEHAVTIGNDPATGGLTAILPDIRGDAPSPLTIDMTPGTSAFVQPWISVCPVESSRPWPGTVVYQAEDGQLGDGAITESATAYSAGQRVRVNISGDTGEQRFVAWPVKPPFAGRWRIFARVGLVQTDTGLITLNLRGDGAAASAPRKTVLEFDHKTVPTTERFLVDMGVYTFPKGNLPTSRPYSMTTSGVVLNWWATSTGTASARLLVDYMVAVPLDLPLDASGPVTTLDFQEFARTHGDVTLRLNSDDAAAQEITSFDAAGVPSFALSNPETPAGAFPAVTPGAQNVLTLLTRRTTIARPRVMLDTITEATALTVSYRPLYLYHAGS